MDVARMSLVRIAVLLGGLALILVVANRDILAKRQTISEGRLVLIEIQPLDPRSLLQGDYMALRYAEQVMPAQDMIAALPRSGTAVVALDRNGVARFVRLDDGAPLAAGEQRLLFKHARDSGTLQYGAEAFFFQEGDADLYNDAKYGVLRVDADGNSILVGLADASRNMLNR
jgi:uncharacterized membrane-anchored protein